MNQVNENSKKTVVVGMSGGVDSSVVAFLLKQQGFDVVGLHMKTENEETSFEDEQTVVHLCESLGIKYEIVNYSNEMQVVKDYFINEYITGRTPNPCVVCNKSVKFKPFVEYANKIGADYFATGHYACIEHQDGKHILKIAADSEKDQTYFLCELSATQLEKALFPLGSLTKEEVRKIAEDNGLVSAHKKDSFDVCFIGSKKFKDFMDQHYPEKEGELVDIKTNKVVGKHTGISKYTLGQRKGLGIGGGHGTNGECWFVVKKDIKNNIVYVTEGSGEELFSDALVSNKVNWIPEKPAYLKFECEAKFRYRQKPQKVVVNIKDDGSVFVEFAEKQRAITPGQYVVFYDNDRCLGGGTIDLVVKNNNVMDL